MAVAVATKRRDRALGSERVREALVGYGFVALPMPSSSSSSSSRSATRFYISRYDWGIFKGEYVGWDNYRTLYHDTVFWRHAVRNTLVYTAVVVPLQMALGLSLAVVVNQAIRFRTFFRAAFYFPSLAASAAIATIAIYILASDGLLNTVLDHLGYDHNNAWFTQQSTALPSIMGLNAWTTSGTIMLFYLAALQSIPTDVYEAAAIDGAGPWRTFRKVTFPLLKPAHFFVAVVSIIGALQMFDQSFIIGGGAGGPNYSTLTSFSTSTTRRSRTSTSATRPRSALVLFLFIFTVTLIQRLLFGRPRSPDGDRAARPRSRQRSSRSTGEAADGNRRRPRRRHSRAVSGGPRSAPRSPTSSCSPLPRSSPIPSSGACRRRCGRRGDGRRFSLLAARTGRSSATTTCSTSTTSRATR